MRQADFISRGRVAIRSLSSRLDGTLLPSSGCSEKRTNNIEQRPDFSFQLYFYFSFCHCYTRQYLSLQYFFVCLFFERNKLKSYFNEIFKKCGSWAKEQIIKMWWYFREHVIFQRSKGYGAWSQTYVTLYCYCLYTVQCTTLQV